MKTIFNLQAVPRQSMGSLWHESRSLLTPVLGILGEICQVALRCLCALESMI